MIPLIVVPALIGFTVCAIVWQILKYWKVSSLNFSTVLGIFIIGGILGGFIGGGLARIINTAAQLSAAASLTLSVLFSALAFALMIGIGLQRKFKLTTQRTLTLTAIAFVLLYGLNWLWSLAGI